MFVGSEVLVIIIIFSPAPKYHPSINFPDCKSFSLFVKNSEKIEIVGKAAFLHDRLYQRRSHVTDLTGKTALRRK